MELFTSIFRFPKIEFLTGLNDEPLAYRLEGLILAIKMSNSFSINGNRTIIKKI